MSKDEIFLCKKNVVERNFFVRKREIPLISNSKEDSLRLKGRFFSLKKNIFLSAKFNNRDFSKNSRSQYLQKTTYCTFYTATYYERQLYEYDRECHYSKCRIREGNLYSDHWQPITAGGLNDVIVCESKGYLKFADVATMRKFRTRVETDKIIHVPVDIETDRSNDQY